MPTLANINECTGCSACINACAKGAIRMEADKEGFLQPKIDTSLCVDCGLCEKSCPIVNKVENKNAESPRTYALWHKEDRTKSSSGGAFSAFARKVLAEGGVVYGAAYNPFPVVRHIAVERVEDLEKLRGSKYLQSEMGDCYKQVKKNLIDGRKVLFTGTPCQVAGLKSYLRKPYENLMLLDIACHGTPSNKVFKAYLEKLKNRLGLAEKDLEDMNYEFRRRDGWGKTPSISPDRSSCRMLYGVNNLYMKAFDKAALFRKSCYNCPFARIPRVGDCTIADFWGIGCYGDKFAHDVSKGVSLVLVNNTHGEKALSFVDGCFIEERHLDEALHLNHNVVGPSKLHPQRDAIIEAFIDPEQTLDVIDKKYKVVPHTLKSMVSEFASRTGLYDTLKKIYNKIR